MSPMSVKRDRSFLWSNNRQYGGSRMGRRGESIFRRKDGRWEARYLLGKDPTTGKAKYRSVYGSTYSEAKEKRIRAMKKTYSSHKNGRLIEAIWLWLEEKEPEIKEQTYRRYRQCIDAHIIPCSRLAPPYSLAYPACSCRIDKIALPTKGEAGGELA